MVFRATETNEAPAGTHWSSGSEISWGAQERSGRILVVDDDAALLSLMRILLSSSGYEVELARDGGEALSLLAVKTYDLILLDLEMPKMNGRAFFREYRSRGGATPVVVISAYGAAEATKELGAQAFVPKPFEPETLVRKVESLLAKG